MRRRKELRPTKSLLLQYWNLLIVGESRDGDPRLRISMDFRPLQQADASEEEGTEADRAENTKPSCIAGVCGVPLAQYLNDCACHANYGEDETLPETSQEGKRKG